MNPWIKGGSLALLLAGLHMLVSGKSPTGTTEADALPLEAPTSLSVSQIPQAASSTKAPCPPGTLPDAGACIPEPQDSSLR